MNDINQQNNLYTQQSLRSAWTPDKPDLSIHLALQMSQCPRPMVTPNKSTYQIEVFTYL